MINFIKDKTKDLAVFAITFIDDHWKYFVVGAIAFAAGALLV